jgi:DNA-binding NarL/FixJ family response regulator
MGRRIGSLLIVEDDAMLRAHLASVLSGIVVADAIVQAGTLAEARRLQRAIEPDLILLDVGLPDGSGLELLVEQHEHPTRAEIVVLSSFSDEETIVRAIRLGASGYLLKQESGDQVAEALQQILDGVPPLSPSVAQCIMLQLRSAEPEDAARQSGPKLPPRQQRTLELLARGMTYLEIAEAMSITFHTVSTHAQEIYNKLAVRSRAEAVHRAREMGILR